MHGHQHVCNAVVWHSFTNSCNTLLHVVFFSINFVLLGNPTCKGSYHSCSRVSPQGYVYITGVRLFPECQNTSGL